MRDLDLSSARQPGAAAALVYEAGAAAAPRHSGRAKLRGALMGGAGGPLGAAAAPGALQSPARGRPLVAPRLEPGKHNGVAVAVKTFNRPDCILRSVERWQRALPSVPFYYLDDGTESTEASRAALAAHPGAVRVEAGGVDVGTAHGRNLLVDAVARDGFAFTLMADEDFMVDDSFDLSVLWTALHEGDADIVGLNRCETYGQCRGHHALLRAEGRLYVVPNASRWAEPPTPSGGCVRTDLVQQIFLARTQALVHSPWDDRLKNNDHYDMFLSAQAHGLRVFYCPGLRVRHEPLCQCVGSQAISSQMAARGAGCAARGRYLQTRGRRWETFVPYLAHKWGYEQLWDEEAKIIAPSGDAAANVNRRPFSPARIALGTKNAPGAAVAALRHLAPGWAGAHAAADALATFTSAPGKAERVQVDRCRYRMTVATAATGGASASWTAMGGAAALGGAADSAALALCPYLVPLLHVERTGGGVAAGVTAGAARQGTSLVGAPLLSPLPARPVVILLAAAGAESEAAHPGDLVEADERDALSAVMYLLESAAVLADELGDGASAVVPAVLLDDEAGAVAAGAGGLDEVHEDCHRVVASAGGATAAAAAAAALIRSCAARAVEDTGAGAGAAVVVVALASPWLRPVGDTAFNLRLLGGADGFAYAPVAPAWPVGLLAAPAGAAADALDAAAASVGAAGGLDAALAPAARKLHARGWAVARDRPEGLRDHVRPAGAGLSAESLAEAALSEHLVVQLDGALGQAVSQALASDMPFAAVTSLRSVRLAPGATPGAHEAVIVAELLTGAGAARQTALARVPHPFPERLESHQAPSR